MSATGPIHVLVVDDDVAVLSLLRGILEKEGYVVHCAKSGAEALAALEQHSVGLITLDLTLGGEDGLAVARRIQSRYDVPIIIVSAKADDVDRIVGLELGADDYIVKPFNLREVLARVRAVLRRSERKLLTANQPEREQIQFGCWLLDLSARELRRASGEAVSLTTSEFDLLEAFLRRRGRVLKRDVLIDLIRGNNADLYERSIDTLVARLRRKIEPDPENPVYIKTVRGAGYMFTPTNEPGSAAGGEQLSA